MATNTNTATVDIQIAGETRQITFEVREVGTTGQFFGGSKGLVACRIGKGTKIHRNSLGFFSFDSEAEAKKVGYYGQHIVTDAEGRVWGWQPNRIRNSNRISVVGWADAFEGTGQGSKQNYYGGYES